jgi:hypothetical protein
MACYSMAKDVDMHLWRTCQSPLAVLTFEVLRAAILSNNKG